MIVSNGVWEELYVSLKLRFALAVVPVLPLGLLSSAHAQTVVGLQAAADGTVPRAADGHPSLAGLWGGANGALPTGEGVELFAGRGGNFYGFEEDNGLA